MKIYTKTGDAGETRLFTGKCVPKDSPYMDALGMVDECNSTIGMTLSLLPDEEVFSKYRQQLISIQNTLFDLGAAVATPHTDADEKKIEQTRFGEQATLDLEAWIDAMDKELPELRQFILPGGHPVGANLHLARTICRRAERFVVTLFKSGDVKKEPLVYLNRLSDYLFMAARLMNQLLEVPETTWSK